MAPLKGARPAAETVSSACKRGKRSAWRLFRLAFLVHVRVRFKSGNAAMQVDRPRFLSNAKIYQFDCEREGHGEIGIVFQM